MSDTTTLFKVIDETTVRNMTIAELLVRIDAWPKQGLDKDLQFLILTVQWLLRLDARFQERPSTNLVKRFLLVQKRIKQALEGGISDR